MEKKKILTPAQVADSQRLKALYEAKKKELGITQQSIADCAGHISGCRRPLPEWKECLKYSGSIGICEASWG
jgi:hypothetical protein